jgi:hypothetical protein
VLPECDDRPRADSVKLVSTAESTAKRATVLTPRGLTLQLVSAEMTEFK